MVLQSRGRVMLATIQKGKTQPLSDPRHPLFTDSFCLHIFWDPLYENNPLRAHVLGKLESINTQNMAVSLDFKALLSRGRRVHGLIDPHSK